LELLDTVGIQAAGAYASNDTSIKKQDFLFLPKTKMFVPLFVGLYASHLSFRVLKTLCVYKVARNGKGLFYDFWKNPLVWGKKKDQI